MISAAPATFVDPTTEALASLAPLPDDRPVVMPNLLRFRPDAAYASDSRVVALGA